MVEYNDVQVVATEALGRTRSAISQLSAASAEQLRSTRQSMNAISAHCALAVADRHREVRNCECDPNADCSPHRRRYETALRVQREVERILGELAEGLGARGRTVAERGEHATTWLISLIRHLDGVAGAPDSATPLSRNGSSPSLPGVGEPAGDDVAATAGQGTSHGFMFAPGVERVRLNLIQISSSLWESEPPKGGARREDMLWAAETFRDQIVPHLARGGSREELGELDTIAGNNIGFRRLSGAYDVYLGDHIPSVTIDGAGVVTDIGAGRHRILAAQEAGLTWLPMRVHRVS